MPPVTRVDRYASGMAETMRIKLDPGVRADKKKLERLLGEGWTIADKTAKGILEWGRKTEYLLTR